MPKLSISTIVELVAAARNNSERAVICMAITDRDGKGVTGLTESNFTIDDLLVAPGGSGLRIDTIVPNVRPGFYNLDVVPSNTWEVGVYVLGVTVESGDDDGTKLVKMVLE